MKKYKLNFNNKTFYEFNNDNVGHKLKVFREAVMFWMENPKFYPKFKDLKVKMSYISETDSFYYECEIKESFLVRHNMTNTIEFLNKCNY